MMKVTNPAYEKNMFLGSDILYCSHFTPKNAVKKVDDKWVDDLTKDKVFWLEDYRILSKKEIAELV